ncbi:MAG: hypothetical protein CSA50_08970 [Gammaproteobacteria bacterium]|nr:MAG: hypothetical protein CSA50_08970 [Gammaproteobacteria bacterium]
MSHIKKMLTSIRTGHWSIVLLAVPMAGCNPPESTASTWYQTEATIKSATKLDDGVYAYSLAYPATASTAVNEAGEPITGPITQNVFGLSYLPKAGQTLAIEYLVNEPLMYRVVQPWGNGKDAAAVAGVYIYGHEVESFTPCDTKTDYWITGHKTVLGTLKEASLAKARQLAKPYQGVYAELRLALLPAAEDGFAADYDGVVEALEVKTWASDIPETCLAAPSASDPKPATTESE